MKFISRNKILLTKKDSDPNRKYVSVYRVSYMLIYIYLLIINDYI